VVFGYTITCWEFLESMSTQFALDIAQRALVTGLMVVSPVLVAALVIGLVMSFLQTLTQIHDVTLTLVPKLLVVGVVLILFLPWMLDTMTRFTQEMFALVGQTKGL